MSLTVVSAQADPPLFQTPKEYPGTPGLGHGAVISADFNGDGFPDLAMVDVAAGAVRVLLNQRNGSFAAAVLYPSGAGAAAVTAADFDGDSHVDLAVANMLDSTVAVLANRGDGTFARAASYSIGLLPARVLTADFNGDGLPDLAIANSSPTDNVVVLLNQGGDRFARSQTLTEGIGVLGGLLSMQTADVNGDHRPDLLVVRNFADSGCCLAVVMEPSPPARSCRFLSLRALPWMMSTTTTLWMSRYRLPSKEPLRSSSDVETAALPHRSSPASIGTLELPQRFPSR